MASANDMLRKILADNVLDDNELRRLRRQIFQDNHITIHEADMIFEIDTKATKLPKEWNHFFVNIITDFLIRQTLPIGYVDSIHSNWLIQRIENDGHINEATEMELMLNILRLAQDVPRDLELYALNKVRDKIIKRAASGNIAITTEDTDLMKRVLYASSGSGGFSICKEEAQFLFDLEEVCQNADNTPEWQKLFVGAIANHVMTMGAPEVASAEDTKRNQEWLKADQGIEWSINSITNSFKVWFSQHQNDDNNSKPSIFLDTERLHAAEVIDIQEATWLIEHLNRDGNISANEQALLKFFKDECPNIHENLGPLLRYAA